MSDVERWSEGGERISDLAAEERSLPIALPELVCLRQCSQRSVKVKVERQYRWHSANTTIARPEFVTISA